MMDKTADRFPGYEPLSSGVKAGINMRKYGIPKVNGHIHTPYSFSAFSDMEEPFLMAREEGIIALGINDFYTVDGYPEFAAKALEYRVFPLFNIEFMALQKEEQYRGIRVNDPVNPGRTYLSGKGLRYPVSLPAFQIRKMETLVRESNRQTYLMVDKLNQYLAGTFSGMTFDAEELQNRLARGLLRERHIAMAIRIALTERFRGEMALTAALTEIFGGSSPKSDLSNLAALENEIRNYLLKAGGPAYVPEDEKAFLSLEEVLELIREAGGIPCYPVLLDDAKGNFTDFEKDWVKMAIRLMNKGIYMIELIPGRNDFHVLKEFVLFFRKHGFTVSFGTEHNTPQLDPLTIRCRGGAALDKELMAINLQGAAVIAAHQYLVANGQPGFPVDHFPSPKEIEKLELLGLKVINAFI
ncbi:MAG TPA: PHP domain-containing protein [Prolixibacteraceae bacterium]|nr:PHP domain-containing protein [Prolixibacteraceae bacterium]HOS00797.1 PHP domain-containing protein [Prolixibacteraceae bacterium]